MNLQSDAVRNRDHVKLTQHPDIAAVFFQQRFRRGPNGGKVFVPGCSRYTCRHDEQTNSECVHTTLCPAPRTSSYRCHVPDVLQKRPSTPTLKKYTISYLRDQTKSFDYTLTVMASLEKQIYAEIARLGGNAGLERIMKALHVEA